MPSRKLHLVSEWRDESQKLRARYDRMAAEFRASCQSRRVRRLEHDERLTERLAFEWSGAH